MKNLGYIHSREVVLSRIKKLPKDSGVRQDSESEITKVLFAPDPDTGMPCGNLGSALSAQPLSVQKSVLGEIPSPTGNNGVDSADLALETVKLRSESNDDFNERMRELAKQELEKSKTK